MSETTVANDVGPPVIALFYYRPVNHPGHGETQYVVRVVDELAQHASLEVVAPALALSRSSPNAYFTMVRNLVRMLGDQLRFFWQYAHRGPAPRLLVVIDAYGGLLPAFWSRFQSIPMVYFASDPARVYAKSLQESGIPGGWLVRVFRAPIETVLMRFASLIVVRSRWMLQEVGGGQGGSRLPLRVWEHPPQVDPPDLPAIAAVRARAQLDGRVGVLMLGDFEYPPNRESAGFLFSEVLPRLRREAPQVRLVLVGPGSDRLSIPNDDNFVALGPVDRISPIAYACAIGLAPSTVAGGTSAKTIDYLAHGLACLVTPEIARTLPGHPSLHVSSRDQYADSLIDLSRRVPVPTMDPIYLRSRWTPADSPGGSDKSETLTAILKLGALDRSSAPSPRGAP